MQLITTEINKIASTGSFPLRIFRKTTRAHRPQNPNGRVLSRNLRQTEHPFIQSKSDVIIALARAHAQNGKIP